MEGGERPCLAERVVAAEQRLRLAGDRVGEVLELELVRVLAVEADLLRCRRRARSSITGLLACQGSSTKSDASLPITSSSSRFGSAVPQSNVARTSPGKRISPVKIQSVPVGPYQAEPETHSGSRAGGEP